MALYPLNAADKTDDTYPHTKESLDNSIDLYEAWNKPEKANEWRAKLSQTDAFDRVT